ncbi:MAG: pyruvate phosphate dikinase, partial [Candidatus Cloacimonetes bacterium]|nr:pyruvate phosphate dikinase [Candidatus Cloacimonadota bacterium]
MTKLQSKALSDNMAVTKVFEISLDEDALWLLKSTKSHFGIYGRCKEFLEEVYHPFMNLEIAMNLLRVGVLGDLWFYLNFPDRERVLKVIYGCYLNIAGKLDERTKEKRFVSDLLELFTALSNHENMEDKHLDMILGWLCDWKERFGEHYSRLGGSFLKAMEGLKSRSELNTKALELLRGIYGDGLRFWEIECASFPVERMAFADDGFPQYSYFQKLRKRLERVSELSEMAMLPFFNDISNRLRELVCSVDSVEDRIQYIFYLLGLTGMEDLRDHLLWDLNRELSRIYTELGTKSIPETIDSVFVFLASFEDSHRSIVLDCLLTIGKNVIKSGDKQHISHFIHKYTAMELTPPGKVFVRDDWQLDTDKNHIKHLRLCLELIAINPLLCKDLLAYLIISVSKVGVFISDEDLFQKDVSALLNAKIGTVFIQLKHLLRQFPVFYNEIGAEGDIREFSTEIDEMSQREDRLIHFLRKQVHTESNNTHIQLCASIIDYWIHLDASRLLDIVPQDVMLYLQSEASLLSAQSQAVKDFLTKQKMDVTELKNLSWQRLEKLFEGSKDDWHLHRLNLLCNIHLLLRDKYGLDPYDIVKFLSSYRFFDAKEQNRLRTSLSRRDYESSIRQLLGYIGKLNNIILNPKLSSSWENIYYKRHIAAGIPSMYGTYREVKLEAMGMVFRIENLVRRLFSYSLQQVNLSYINHKNMRRIIRVLELYDFAMRQEVLTNAAFSSAVSMLDSAQSISNCSLEQY